MARMHVEYAQPAEISAAPSAAESLFNLGLQCCTGREAPQDLVAAHKWFNLAAMQGSVEARRYRHEISQEMSAGQIAQAQREARAWLTRH
jgi:TPR repeat protein